VFRAVMNELAPKRAEAAAPSRRSASPRKHEREQRHSA
jgi:hypothetical protein